MHYLPSPGDRPDPGIKPGSPTLQATSLPSEPPGKPMFLLDYLQTYFLSILLIMLYIKASLWFYSCHTLIHSLPSSLTLGISPTPVRINPPFCIFLYSNLIFFPPLLYISHSALNDCLWFLFYFFISIFC